MTWTELPDDERQTGRTTNMIERVLFAAENRGLIVVWAAHAQHARHLQQALHAVGAYDKKARIVVRPYTEHAHGDPIETRYFWDHYAVDLLTRERVEQALRQRERLLVHSLPMRQRESL